MGLLPHLLWVETVSLPDEATQRRLVGGSGLQQLFEVVEGTERAPHLPSLGESVKRQVNIYSLIETVASDYDNMMMQSV